MTSEARLLIETWEAVRDRLPANQRSDVAEGIVRAFAEFGFDHKDLADVTDEDNDLAEALDAVYEAAEDEDEFGFDEGDE